MDAPSVSLLLGSESFSPSDFMNINTREKVSPFGEVGKFGNTRSMSLCSCSVISIPSRYTKPKTPARTKRANKRVTDVLVCLFLADSSYTLMIYCGGKVTRGLNI